MSRRAALLIATAVAALALSGPALALDPADHSADLDAAAERQAAAADCLAAAADEATVSVTATCTGGGSVALPRRATDPAGTITTTCAGAGAELVVSVEYAEPQTCDAYLRALAVRDAPAAAE